MKLSTLLSSIFVLAPVSLAATSFAGSNLFYAAGLSADQRATLLGPMQSAGMKVIRVWLDGESTATSKGTPIPTYPDLEPNAIGTYNSTVLDLMDDFMVDAHDYGIKVLISMHSWNALSKPDAYGNIYGTGYFYEQDDAINAFDNRLRFILNHEHTTLGRPWKELSEYIFAFEAQNEAMIGKGQDYISAHQSWQCDRASTIKAELGSDSGILVTTGGEQWLSESVMDEWLNCADLDVVAIHAYGTGDFETSAIQTYVDKATAAGKKLLFQEWGACYFDTSNNDCPTGNALAEDTRNNNIQTWARQITAAGVPWLYWQVLPNNDPHYGFDFEVGVGESGFSALSTVAQEALSASTPFDFSAYIL